MTKVEEVIHAFALAHMDAEDNPRRMLENPASIKECADRMVVCEAADIKLWGLVKEPNLPPVLLEFFEASADKGCLKCWISSNRKNQHPECQIKIQRWFDKNEALIKYGATLK